MDEKYAMSQDSSKMCTAATRPPIAVAVLTSVQHLAERAQTLAERINAKLSSVMTSEQTCNDVSRPKDSIEYPPLFSDLRNSIQVIESALNSIENALSHTEL